MFIRKYILLVPILLLILIGCTKTKDIETPANFRFEAGFLYWNEISYADHYVIEINDESKMAYNNKLDLKEFNTGNYTARIATFYKGTLSEFSPIIEFQLIQNESFEDILITDERISWKSHPGLTYEVEIYNQSTNVSTNSLKGSNNYYMYGDLQKGSYLFTIQAYLADTLVTSTEIRIILGDFDYVRNAGLVLDLEVPNDIYLEDTKLVEDTDYITDEFGVIINSNVLDELDKNGVVLKLIYENPVYVYVNIITIDAPEMISSNSIVYAGLDLSFQFELHGGRFTGLGGNNIDIDDYVFLDETLTIKASYIDEIILNQPDRSMLILTYVLQNDPHVVIGYIFISLP